MQEVESFARIHHILFFGLRFTCFGVLLAAKGLQNMMKIVKGLISFAVSGRSHFLCEKVLNFSSIDVKDEKMCFKTRNNKKFTPSLGSLFVSSPADPTLTTP